jgi:hypothetical protein
MRSGFSPIRRNRNIGTAKQGHGRQNRMVIPCRHEALSPLEVIGEHASEQRKVAGKTVTFIVEETRADSSHPCSIADVARLLESVPSSDWAGLNTIIFRQPTRKQAILDPAWGRLRYSGRVTAKKMQVIAEGPMLMLDAVNQGFNMNWSAALAPEDQVELARLREDGHSIERVGNRYAISVSNLSARNTQLFRTVLHEIGHWFDWLEKVETPAARGADIRELIDNYFARPQSEREAFAHRYADSMKSQLSKNGAIPFEQQ